MPWHCNWTGNVFTGSGDPTREPSACAGLIGPKPVARIDTTELSGAGFEAELNVPSWFHAAAWTPSVVNTPGDTAATGQFRQFVCT